MLPSIKFLSSRMTTNKNITMFLSCRTIRRRMAACVVVITGCFVSARNADTRILVPSPSMYHNNAVLFHQ